MGCMNLHMDRRRRKFSHVFPKSQQREVLLEVPAKS